MEELTDFYVKYVLKEEKSARCGYEKVQYHVFRNADKVQCEFCA
jgi:hypothetical protein